MKKLRFVVVGLLAVFSGCVSSIPTLEGRWQTESTTTRAQSTMREIITYTFDESTVTRTLEQRITSLDGLLSASLIATDTATYTTDESTTPARIDLSGLTQVVAPTNAAFLSAAAISGQTERGVTLAFYERADSLFINKGLFELGNGSLRIKFGSTTDYPIDLGDALEVDRLLKLLGY